MENYALRRFLAAAAVQTKLEIGPPGDRYEQEAEHTADAVMAMTDSPSRSRFLVSAGPAANTLQRFGGQSRTEVAPQPEEEDESLRPRLTVQANGMATGGRLQTAGLQRREEPQQEGPVGAAGGRPWAGEPEGFDAAVPVQAKAEASPPSRPPGAGFARELNAARGGGRPLSGTMREFMEPRFGVDFGAVRVHQDARADRLNRAIGARAFASGRDVLFRQGGFDEQGAAGRRLLAHELTHVVQQNSGNVIRPKLGGGGGLFGSVSRPGTLAGLIQRAVEVHLNLRQPQKVRVYRSPGSDMEFTTSAGTGDRTSRYIRRRHYPILDKVGPPPAKTPAWGLQYFAQITSGGVGFHSNICFPRRRTLCRDGLSAFCGPPELQRVGRTLRVDGTPRSHGCARLAHGNARSLFNAVSTSTRVYIYDRSAWRSPSWSSSSDRALP